MSSAEDSVSRLLKPLLAREQQRLDPQAQTTIALWATLRAAMFAVTDRDSCPFPSEHFKWMRTWKTPPPGTHVWIVGYDGNDEWNLRFKQQSLVIAPPPHDSERPNAHWTTFAFGHLGFQIFGVDYPEPMEVSDPPHALPIWPTAGDAVYEPFPSLNGAALELMNDGLRPIPHAA